MHPAASFRRLKTSADSLGTGVGWLPVLLPVLPLLLALSLLPVLPPWLVLHCCRCYRRGWCRAVAGATAVSRAMLLCRLADCRIVRIWRLNSQKWCSPMALSLCRPYIAVFVVPGRRSCGLWCRLWRRLCCCLKRRLWRRLVRHPWGLRGYLSSAFLCCFCDLRWCVG